MEYLLIAVFFLIKLPHSQVKLSLCLLFWVQLECNYKLSFWTHHTCLPLAIAAPKIQPDYNE